MSIQKFTKNSFTLLELLLVVAVIMILASLLLPALSKAKEKSRAITCLSNLKQLNVAALGYAGDADGNVAVWSASHTGFQANGYTIFAGHFLASNGYLSCKKPVNFNNARIIYCPRASSAYNPWLSGYGVRAVGTNTGILTSGVWGAYIGHAAYKLGVLSNPSTEVFFSCEVSKAERFYHWPSMPYVTFAGNGGFKRDVNGEVRTYIISNDVYSYSSYYKTTMTQINNL